MDECEIPLSIQDRYGSQRISGRRMTRLEENTLGDFSLEPETAWIVGTQNAGIFIGGCDPLAAREQLKRLRQRNESSVWIVVASTKNMALLFTQELLDVKRRANAAVPKRPVARDNIIVATPELLRWIEIPVGQGVAAIILEDMLCRVHLLRGGEPRGRNYESNDRPQLVADFRNRLAEGMWMPPLILLTERHAKSIETETVARAYCLDTWWFVDGATFSCRSVPSEKLLLPQNTENQATADEPLVCRSLRGRQKTLVADHSDMLANATNLAGLLDQKGDDDPPPAPVGPFPERPGTITNSIGMRLVPIPAGEFLMGSPRDYLFADPEEEFRHRVQITRSFLMGMHQVTQSEYEQITGENPSYFRGADLPVEHLAWKDAERFCELLSRLPDERAAGRRYRLPTEAEWEYACRAGTTTPFNTGDSLEAHQARFAFTDRTRPKQTAPVGTYPPNAWGLFDMHGNVWEWTADWFSASFYRKSPTQDPAGPPTGTHHTLRGGSASVESYECRSGIRGVASAVDGPESESGDRFPLYGDFGMRVVCEDCQWPKGASTDARSGIL